MSGQEKDEQLIRQIHEAVKLGAYGDADIPHNFCYGGSSPVPIRNRQTGEVELLLIIRDNEIEYFRRSR